MGSIGILKVKAATSRATCQECHRKIDKGAAAVALYHTHFGDRVYYHRACVIRSLAGGLLAAGKTVVESWIEGDLAGAVRGLYSEINQIEQEGGTS